MKWHIRILGFLYLAIGIIAGYVGAVKIYPSIGSFPTSSQGSFAFVVAAIWVILAVFGALIGLAIPTLMIVGGIGLLGMRPWARAMSIVLSMVLLPAIPIGAAATLYPSPVPTLALGAALGVLGMYGLWVLLNQRTQRLFQPQATTA